MVRFKAYGKTEEPLLLRSQVHVYTTENVNHELINGSAIHIDCLMQQGVYTEPPNYSRTISTCAKYSYRLLTQQALTRSYSKYFSSCRKPGQTVSDLKVTIAKRLNCVSLNQPLKHHQQQQQQQRPGRLITRKFSLNVSVHPVLDKVKAIHINITYIKAKT